MRIERQKRIAERSSSRGSNTAASKRISAESKTSITSGKTQETKKSNKPAPVIRSSTIERLATARTTPKVSTIQSNVGQSEKQSVKANGAVPTTLSQKIPRAMNKKPSLNKAKPSENDPKSLNQALSPEFDGQVKDCIETTEALSKESTAVHVTQPSHTSDELQDIKVFNIASLTEKNEGNLDASSFNLGSSMPTKDLSVQKDHLLGNADHGLAKESPVLIEHNSKQVPEISLNPSPPSPNKDSIVSAVNIEENGATSDYIAASSEISEIEISTPPPSDGMTPEGIHSRKKWNSDETSPKATKGFRKLLLFGRKGRSSNAN